MWPFKRENEMSAILKAFRAKKEMYLGEVYVNNSEKSISLKFIDEFRVRYEYAGYTCSVLFEFRCFLWDKVRYTTKLIHQPDYFTLLIPYSISKKGELEWDTKRTQIFN